MMLKLLLLSSLLSVFVNSASGELPNCTGQHTFCIPVIIELRDYTNNVQGNKSPEVLKNMTMYCERTLNCLAPIQCKEAQTALNQFRRNCDLISHMSVDTQPCLTEFFKNAYAGHHSNETSCLQNYNFLDMNLTSRHQAYIDGESCFLDFVKSNCSESSIEYFSKNYKKFADTISIKPVNGICLDPHFQLNGLRCKGMANELNAKSKFIYQEDVYGNDTRFTYVTKLCRDIQNCMNESCTYGETQTGRLGRECDILEITGTPFGRCISKIRTEKLDMSKFDCMNGVDFHSAKPIVACQKFKSDRKCTKKLMKSFCGKEAVEDFKTHADTISNHFNCN